MRFAFNYHPAGELAPRDIVSRAIFNHLQATTADPAHAHVYLDLRPIEPERIRRRFPNIINVCQHWGIDVFEEPIPVAPAAHYWMGGIATAMNQTTIAGLYAIGETASTGVHGANRLASNSLLECLVFANQLSHIEVRSPTRKTELPLLRLEEDWTEQLDQFKSVRTRLPSLMWQSAGICRSQEELESAIASVERWQRELTALSLSQFLFNLSPTQTIQLQQPEAESHLRVALETFNLLDIAKLILTSAAFRTESRGGHYRTDYPQTSPDWRVHTLVQGDRWWTEPVDET